MKNITEVLREFDEKFPEYKGIGAQFPIFAENPNREHIKQFIRQEMEDMKDGNVIKNGIIRAGKKYQPLNY